MGEEMDSFQYFRKAHVHVVLEKFMMMWTFDDSFILFFIDMKDEDIEWIYCKLFQCKITVVVSSLFSVTVCEIIIFFFCEYTVDLYSFYST